jgi:hypothetical protein
LRRGIQRRFPMPLSDRERKVLEELELDLAADDPRLAQELSSGVVEDRFRASSYFGVIAFLIGVALLMAGVASQIVVVGVGGFLLMGTGAYLLVGRAATLAALPGQKPMKPPSR